jgi:hypothetical protein
MFSGASRASETVPSLPEIDGWTCGEPRSVSLDAVSGNQGLWIERDYRTDAGVSLKATLLHGPGPKFYNQPQAGVSSRAGASSYEIISIGGYKSSIEYDPVLGYAVAANAFERKFSLTAEFGAFHERDEVIRCVEILLDAIK